jgi:hypothetical protein
MKNITKGLVALVIVGLSACGGSATDNHYGTTGTAANTITVRTVDEYGNPVNGRILKNGVVVGTREVEINYTPGQDGTVTFDTLQGFSIPDTLDLATTLFDFGEIHVGVYRRTSSSANVCPRAINAQGEQIDATITINGIEVDYLSGSCASVAIDQEVDIQSTGSIGTWATPVYIPAGALKKGQTYNYDLLFGIGGATIYVSTTPENGEIFVDGRSVGWAKGHEPLSIQLPMDEEATSIISFGTVTGHKTPDSIEIKTGDVDISDSETQRFWGLYDAATHALVCFQGMNGESPTTARVLVDKSDKLTTGWDYPACVGLDVSVVHSAEFIKNDNYQSTDVLSISQNEHIGCEGDFAPGKTLDCVGKYFYVQPASERTNFYVEVHFTAPYQGNLEYPVNGRFEKEGVQYEQSTYSWNLGLSEGISIDFLPLGILTPSMNSLSINSADLSEEDTVFDPSTQSWVYTVNYQPPQDAVETCIKSVNQNEANISSQVGMSFDGADALSSWAEDLDCHWFASAGNHLIVPDWLTGYQPAVSQVYIPEGKILVQSMYELPFIPQPTQCQICIEGNPVEAALTLNGHHMGWTNLGQKCLWVDKSVPNTLTLEGKGTRSWTADDPVLNGGFLSITHADF